MKFSALYAATLSVCLGGVEVLKRGLPEPEPELSEQPIAELIAVPPKPEGARPTATEDGAGTRYTDEQCRAHEGDYREACFHALALQRAERDPEGALQACSELAEPLHSECMADVAELHARVDLDWSQQTCTTIQPKKWRDQCWFGLALAWSVHDFELSRSLCDEAGQWQNFCRHDVNGEIAQVDPENALAWCVDTPMTEFQRKGCYHGLGKYLGRTEPQTGLETCLAVPRLQDIHPQQCFHGWGWALAESDPDQALARCERDAQSWRDSCVLGISANMKRFDVERAQALCEQVHSQDLREKCSRFLAR